jgi:hypothetical protein
MGDYSDKVFLKTCREMLTDRFFNYESETIDGEIWKSTSGEKILLFTTIVDSVQIKIVDGIIKILSDMNLNKAIKLYRNGTSSCVNNKVQALCSGDPKIELELVRTSKMMFNPMLHVKQPSMVKCNVEFVKQVKELHSYAMPQLQSDDIVVLWNGWKHGDVVIICKNKCGHKSRELWINEYKCCRDTRFRIVV